MTHQMAPAPRTKFFNRIENGWMSKTFLRSGEREIGGGWNEITKLIAGNGYVRYMALACSFSPIDGARTYTYTVKHAMGNEAGGFDDYTMVGQGSTPKEAKDNYLKLVSWSRRYTFDQLEKGKVEPGDLVYDLYADFSIIDGWRGEVSNIMTNSQHIYLMSSPKEENI